MVSIDGERGLERNSEGKREWEDGKNANVKVGEVRSLNLRV